MVAEIGLASYAAAALAALAASLAVSPPATYQRAAVARQSVISRPTRRSGLSRVLAGRPDALPLRRRAVVSGIAASAIALCLWRVAPGLAPMTMICPPLTVLVMIIALGWVEPARSRRRRQQLLMETPQALELLGSGLAAGLPLRAATAAVIGVFPGPIGEDLGSVLKMADLGLSETDAWRTLRGHPVLGAVAVDLARSADSGTMLVQALNQHAQAARQRRHAALQVTARAVGVRSVLPLMTCFLPAFLLLGVVPSVVSAIVNALS